MLNITNKKEDKKEETLTKILFGCNVGTFAMLNSLTTPYDVDAETIRAIPITRPQDVPKVAICLFLISSRSAGRTRPSAIMKKSPFFENSPNCNERPAILKINHEIKIGE